MNIAETILQQLRTLGRIEMMSWGTHNLRGGKGCLPIMVQGVKFKGHVRITLNGLDLYDIEFFKMWKGEEKLKGGVENVYLDSMVPVIDDFVETDNGSYTGFTPLVGTRTKKQEALLS